MPKRKKIRSYQYEEEFCVNKSNLNDEESDRKDFEMLSKNSVNDFCL